MPLVDVAAADFYLDLMHSVAPGTVVQFGLLDGDPNQTGIELDSTDCPGYARYTVPTWGAFWQAASDGLKPSNPFNLPDATDAWDRAGEWIGMWVDGLLWTADPLAEAVAPSAAGPFQALQVTARF